MKCLHVYDNTLHTLSISPLNQTHLRTTPTLTPAALPHIPFTLYPALHTSQYTTREYSNHPLIRSNSALKTQRANNAYAYARLVSATNTSRQPMKSVRRLNRHRRVSRSGDIDGTVARDIILIGIPTTVINLAALWKF